MDKTIVLGIKILSPVVCVNDENVKTLNVIDTIYTRFQSEQNTNHHGYAQEKLQNFRYIKESYVIPNGSYIRMIDMRNPLDAKLYSGGFVTDDNGYKTTVRSCRGDGVITFNRKKYVFFLQMTMDDVLREQIQKMDP